MIEYHRPLADLCQIISTSVDAYKSFYASYEVRPSASYKVMPSASYEISPIAPYEVVEFVCCKEDHNVNNFNICMRNDTIFSSCNSHDLNMSREITLINNLCVSSFILYQSTSMIYEYSVILQDTHQYMVIPLWVCTSQIQDICYLSTVLIKLAFTMLHICLSIYNDLNLCQCCMLNGLIGH